MTVTILKWDPTGRYQIKYRGKHPANNISVVTFGPNCNALINIVGGRIDAIHHRRRALDLYLSEGARFRVEPVAEAASAHRSRRAAFHEGRS